MATQTFNPTDLSQSAANWAVAQRVVGSFAPHAQVVPNLTVALDPGHLLSGTVLTEVNAQSTDPIAPPASGFRIDRVVIDRTSGAASVITGTPNSLTPPAIPTGNLPVARVFLQNTTNAITNDIIVDERALSDLTPQQGNTFACRAHRNGTNQTGIAGSAYTKVIFTTAEYNVGNGFDTANSRFLPNISGYYLITAQVALAIGTGVEMSTIIYRNGTMFSYTEDTMSTSGYKTILTSGIVYLDGIDDYVEVYTYQTGTTSVTASGSRDVTFFLATRVA